MRKSFARISKRAVSSHARTVFSRSKQILIAKKLVTLISSRCERHVLLVLLFSLVGKRELILFYGSFFSS